MDSRVNPLTGLKERTVKIESFLKLDIQSWGKLEGPNMF